MKNTTLRTDYKTGIDWNQIHNMTKEMAYILGLLWADGYVVAKKGAFKVQLNNLRDDCLYFRKIFDKVGKWTFHDRQQLNRQPQTHIACCEKDFALWLDSMDYHSKSTKSADKILKFIPKYLHSYWFCGLLDGDGSFYISPDKKHHHIIIASGHGQDWSYLENICKELDFSYIVWRRKRIVNSKMTSFSNIQITSKFSVVVFGDYIYQGDLGLPRKRDKFSIMKSDILDKWVKKYKDRGIYFEKRYNTYVIKADNKYLGSAKTLEEAQKKRDLLYKENDFEDKAFKNFKKHHLKYLLEKV